jgi:hypothetical protein
MRAVQLPALRMTRGEHVEFEQLLRVGLWQIADTDAEDLDLVTRNAVL